MRALSPAAVDRVHRYAWAGYLAVGAVLLLAYYLAAPVRGSGVLFNVIGLSPVVAMIVGVRWHRPHARLAWYLFAVGQILFLIGDAFYYGYAAVFDADVPFPSLGDLFYLSVYPSVIAGLVILIRRRSPVGNRNSVIDALIVTIGLALFSWVFLIAPYTHDPTLTLLQKAVSIAYPAMDVGLLAVAIRLTVDGGMSKPSLRMLMLAIVALLAADTIYGLLNLNGGYDVGGLLDIGWVAYYLLWGAAALHPSMRELDQPMPDAVQQLTWRRLALLTSASLMAPTVRAIQAVRGIALEEPVLITSSVMLFSLVVLRMAGSVRDREQAASRERALREAARDLVTATSREDVLDAAMPSLQALVGASHDVRVTVLQPSGELRAWMPETDRSQHWSVRASDLVSLDAEQLRTCGALAVEIEGTRLRSVLRLRPHVDHLIVFPLFVRDEIRGLLFVAGDGAFTGELRDTLQTMSVQIALALESAVLAETGHMRRSEERFRSLVQHSSDLITVVEEDATIKFVSPSVRRVLGLEIHDLVGTSFSELMHPKDRDHLLALLGGSDDGIHQVDMVEARLRDANGTWRDFEILHTNLLQDRNVAGVVLNARDVSERKAFESQLRHQAFHDPVTKLANRALFTDRVDHALARSTRDHRGLAVIFADLDDFKVVNDSLGHAAGDTLLQEVGRRLRGSVRTMDTVARFGGDEFALLIEDVDRLDVVAGIADHILAALTEPVIIDDKEVFIGASIGIAMITGEHAMTSAADELLRNADVAMYMAKRDGKGMYRVFEPDMHASVVARLEVKGALQRAIERNELELHYQPILAISDERVTGLEALVRWRHPERGLVGPAEFVPIAEETGMIGAVGRWVLDQACRDSRWLQERFPRTPPLSFNVNLSVRQLSQPTLVTEVSEALEQSGVDPSSLTLEVTESFLLNDDEATINKLHELKRLGVQLAVDDFGTGYSSLSYLSKFPVDCLKIDRSFVNKLAAGAEASALAEVIVRIGETLNLRTVAEGIEHADQLASLRQMKCDFGQGFLFSRPMPLVDVLGFLRGGVAATGVGE